MNVSNVFTFNLGLLFTSIYICSLYNFSDAIRDFLKHLRLIKYSMLQISNYKDVLFTRRASPPSNAVLQPTLRLAVESAAVHWVIKSEGITGQLLAILVIDEPGFIC